MEQSIWLIIVIVIAILTFIVIIGIIAFAREGGMKSLGDIFNLSKFLEIIGIKR